MDDLDQNTPQTPGDTEEDILASTLGDIGHGLPSDPLHLTISRFREDDGAYTSAITFNRPVRRLYAVGMVQEALWMLLQTGDEYICSDAPMPDAEEDGDDDGEDGGRGDRAKV